MSSIQSVTKYTVLIGDKEKTFNTEAEAVAALAKVEMAGVAQAYVDQMTDKEGKPLSDKDKKGKYNVVLDYLAYNATLAADPEAFEQA
jgi:hypothetical protein